MEILAALSMASTRACQVIADTLEPADFLQAIDSSKCFIGNACTLLENLAATAEPQYLRQLLVALDAERVAVLAHYLRGSVGGPAHCHGLASALAYLADRFEGIPKKIYEAGVLPDLTAMMKSVIGNEAVFAAQIIAAMCMSSPELCREVVDAGVVQRMERLLRPNVDLWLRLMASASDDETDDL